jgi:hypothetical protein
MSSFFSGVGGFLGKQIQHGIAGPLLDLFGLSTKEQKPNSIYQDALQQARSVGYQSPNRYVLFFEGVPGSREAVLTGPPAPGFQWDNKRLSLACTTAVTPSRTLTSFSRDISGPLRNVPYLTNFEMSGQFRFICSADMYEYYAFNRWMDRIIDPVSRIVSYYDDIVANLMVVALPRSIGAETSGGISLGPIRLGSKTTTSAPLSYGTAIELATDNKIFAYKMTEIYPKSISLAGFDSKEATEPLILNVTFNFRECLDVTENAELMSDYMQQVANMYGPAVDEQGNLLKGLNSMVNFGVNTAAMFAKG